jgi:hypothetical protein
MVGRILYNPASSVANMHVTIDFVADSWVISVYMLRNVEPLITTCREYGIGRGLFKTLTLQALQYNP